MVERAVFLDRDGTVIVECEYLSDPEQVQLIDGVPEALRRLHAAGWKLVIVTNQSGIARGLYTTEAFQTVQQRVEQALSAEGVTFDAVYYCPHHPDFTGPCECRKPGPGMYRRAERELGVDLSASVYIGDRRSDVEPAEVFGGRGFLVRTGYGLKNGQTLPARTQSVRHLPEAVEILLRENSQTSRAGGPVRLT